MKIATRDAGCGVGPSMNIRILEQMASLDADIWVLTETHDDLRPRTSGSWCEVNSDQRPREAKDVKDGSRWSTIWSRLPIIEYVRPTHDPVRTKLADHGLVTLTDFGRTGAVQREQNGLIDHFATSATLATRAGVTDGWQRENVRGDAMSDHCGVAINLSVMTALNYAVNVTAR